VRALWLRWTWRDLRAHALQVLATALILAVGAGAFAGLGGLERWRVASADRSLEVSRAHDLRADLAAGDFARAGSLRGALDALPAGTIAAAEERLVVASQVDASRPGATVVVPASLVGIDGREVDRVSVKAGRPGVVLDWNFAHYYGLPTAGSLRVAGLGRVRYTGLGVIPQHFLIVSESAISGAESSLATIYLPLARAQQAVDRPGRVNQLVVRVAPGRSVGAVERRLRSTLGGATITRGADETVTRILYRDAANDQKTYRAFAILLILGATLAAFNLVSRVVESQRREIGIGKALGAEPRLLALRPLALGLQIGVLGALLAVPIGVGLAELIKHLFRAYLPLPAYASTFPAGLFAIGGALAITLPVLAGVLPVRRAVSVAPVDAIRTGHRGASGAGATARLRRLRVPGGELVRLPLRNLARTPRRTIMTFVGLGAVITAVVGVLGMVDSVADIAHRQRATTLARSPDRLEVSLIGLQPRDGALVRALTATPGVRRAEPGLTLDAQATGPSGSVGLALALVDPRSAVWRPEATAGTITGDGILLAEKAAHDLGVSIGDRVRVRHPRLRGRRLVTTVSTVRVMGVHANPVRAFAYMDAGQASRLGLAGIANTVALVPRAGVAPGTLERTLFGREGVGSVRPASADAAALETAIASFRSAIELVAVITLMLALLVAFTSTSVALDERRREYATMQAFGLPPRTGLRVAMTESLVTGIAGTMLGLGLGLVVIAWITRVLLADTFPDLSARMTLAPASVATTLIVGILAVTAAPLLVFRRLRRMDVPSTLRVME
jgi:putative ABC transport system permease protein